MASSKLKARRWIKLFLIALAVLMAIPVFQVTLAAFWSPPIIPMQIQRRIEGGDSMKTRPTSWIPLEKIPKDLIHFIWASEDQTFFKHHGFDIAQLQQAMEQRPGAVSMRGASTITMQCARSVFLWQGRSYVRKALEAYYTLWMEIIMSKHRILELYLNHIELGPGIYGVGAAASEYFGRKPAELTRSQMIALAAILPNPRKWSPRKSSDVVRQKIRRVERLASRAPFPSQELKRE